MDRYGLVKVNNPYAQFARSTLLGLFLVLISAVSIATGFFGVNVLKKQKEEIIEASVVATSFNAGSGTSYDPYQIADASQLAYLAQQVNTINNYSDGLYFELTNNIDLSAYEWEPIGKGTITDSSNAFQGLFDGNGYTISNMLITSSTESNIGLFGFVNSKVSSITSQIKNFGVTGSVTLDTNKELHVAGVVGWMVEGIISNVWSDVEINATAHTLMGVGISAGGVLGGHHGNVDKSPIIRNSYNMGSIIATGDTIVNAGGIAGYYNTSGLSGATGYIEYVHNKARVSGTVAGNLFTEISNVGGLIGNHNGSIDLNNAYSMASTSEGNVTGVGGGDNYVGDLVGKINGGGDINDTYCVTPTEGATSSSVGNIAEFIANADHIDTYGLPLGSGNINWKQQSSFKTFDFDNDWAMSSAVLDNEYPVLQASNNVVVKFNANGGTFDPDILGFRSSLVSIATISGTALGKTAGMVSRPDYVLSGWSTTSGNSNVVNRDENYIVTANDTWYAVWTSTVADITITIEQGGSDIGSSANGTYSVGQTIDLKVSENANYKFEGWTKVNGTGTIADETDPTTTYTVTDADGASGSTIAFKANFFYMYASVNVIIEEGGDNNSSPSGTYFEGDIITLSTAEIQGYTFNGWEQLGGYGIISNASAMSTSYTITTLDVENNENIIFTAKFTENPEPKVPVVVYIESGGDDYGSTQNGDYAEGARIRLRATRNLGYNFDGWTMTNGTGTITNVNDLTTTYYITAQDIINGSTVYFRANFSKKNVPITITFGTNGADNGSTPDGVYDVYTDIDLIALPDIGYEVDTWTVTGGSGIISSATSSVATYEITPQDAENGTPINFNVTFIGKIVKINIARNPVEGGEPTFTGTNRVDETISFQENVNIGYNFTGWTEDGANSFVSNNYTILPTDADKIITVTAYYSKKPVTITIGSTENGNISGSSLSGVYYENDVISLIANADVGYRLDNWTNTNGTNIIADENSSNTNYMVTAQDAENGVEILLTANFVVKTAPVSVIIGEGGTDNGSSINGDYQVGTVINLNALENTNYTFINWTKTNGTGNINNQFNLSTTYTITTEDVDLNLPITFTANFSSSNYWLDYAVEPANDGINYIITNPQELAYIAYQTNNNFNWSSGKNFALTNNINLSGKYFTPIGYGESSNMMQGDFAGNNNIITGLTIDSSQQSSPYLPSVNYIGLFGSAESIIVNNLTLDAVNISATASNYVGAVLGFDDGSTFTNVDIAGDISGSFEVGGIVGHGYNTMVDTCTSAGTVSGSQRVGGFVGYLDNIADIIVSVNNASVSGNSYVGGIAGYVYSDAVGVDPDINDCINNGAVTATSSFVGGITGYIIESDVIRCVNNASITGVDYVGGMVGYADKSGVIACYNTARVDGDDYVGGAIGKMSYATSALETTANIANVTGDLYVGGLIGHYDAVDEADAVLLDLEDIYNTGNITGTQYVGGICGRAEGEIDNAYNVGNIIGTTSNTGPIAGYLQYTEPVRGTYFLPNLTSINGGSSWGNGYTVPSASKTSVELQNQETFLEYNFAITGEWAMGQGLNNGYPVLQTLYPNVNLVNFQNTADGVNYYSYKTRTIVTGQNIGINNMPEDATRAGHVFTEWNESQDGTGVEFTQNTTINTDASAFAQYIAATVVTINAGPNGSVTGSTSSGVYPEGYVLTLQATPNEGYDFVKWTGTYSGNLTIANPSTTYTITAEDLAVGNVTLTANFIQSNYWLDYAVEPINDGTNYTITSPGELAYIAQQVNNVVDWSIGKKITLANDIDLSGKYWTPIGYNATYRFKAFFEGNNKTIAGLTIDSAQQSGIYLNDINNVGLIGYSEDLTINSLTITSANITTTGSYVGGFIGFDDNVTANYINFSGNVTGNDYVAGIVGYGLNPYINYATVSGSISGDQKVSGVVSYIDNAAEVFNSINNATINGNSYVAGIAAYVYSDAVGEDPEVIDNINNSNVTATGNYVGGIVGYIVESDINRCTNNAVITGIDYVGGIAGRNLESGIFFSYNAGNVSGDDYIGGIAGYAGSSNSDVRNCANEANISGDLYVGGIIGHYDALDANSATLIDLQDIYNTGDITGTQYVGGINGRTEGEIDNAYNVGTVIGTTTNTGPITGYLQYTEPITGTYYLLNKTSVNGGSTWGNGYFVASAGKTSAELQNQETFPEYSFLIGSDWAMGQGLNNGYPVLQRFYTSVSLVNFQNTADGVNYSAYKIRTIVTGQKVGVNNMPANPTRSSHVFLSWNESQDGSGSEFTGNTTVGTDMTIYPQYFRGVMVDIQAGPNGNISGSSANGMYAEGAVLTLNATANSSYGFVKWSGTYAGTLLVAKADTTYTITAADLLAGDVKLIANFMQSDYWLDYSVEPVNDGVTYTINAPGELAYIAEQTNLSSTWSDGKTFNVAYDIDLSGKYWTPIGYDAAIFQGVFNGNGHAINGLTVDSSQQSGIYLRNTSKYYVGLFGRTLNTAITNITLTNINLTTTGNYVGGISGYDDSTIFTNVNVSGSLSGVNYVGGIIGLGYNYTSINESVVNADVAGSYYVGGIVGDNNDDSNITNATVYGSVTGTADQIGGIAGYSRYDGDISYSSNYATVSGRNYVGGIIGYQYDNDTLSEPYAHHVTNHGNISGTGNYIAGVVGRCYYSEVAYAYNTGNVTGSATSDYVAGITGYIAFDSYDIVYCGNTGDITGDQYVAGIVGYASSIDDAEILYNTGTIQGATSYIGGIAGRAYVDDLDQVYNVGTVTGNHSYTGPIFGYGSIIDPGSIYYLSSVTSQNNGSSWSNGRAVPGAMAHSLEALKNQDTFVGFNFSNPGAWAMGAGINNGHPVLQWLNPNVSTVDFQNTTDTVTYTSYKTRTIVDGESIGASNMPPDPTAGPSFYFTEWNENLNGSGLTFDPNKTITADDVAYAQYYVATTVTINSADANGNVVGSSSNGLYEQGQVLTLKANPNSGYEFIGWSGTYTNMLDVISSDTTYTINAGDIASGTVTLTANFMQATNYWLDYAIEPASSGSVYTITSPGELAYLAQQTNIADEWSVGKTFNLANDINLTGKYWTPIGYSGTYDFKGIFDGKYKVITGLEIDTSAQPTGQYLRSSNYIGLFGYIRDGSVKNVILEDVNISSTGLMVGAIAGQTYTTSTISNSKVTGTITGANYVGGIVGRAYYVTTVDKCLNDTNITTTGGYVGGIIGYAYGTSTSYSRVLNCSNTGAITASGVYAGGIVGYSRYGDIYYCLNVGTVIGSDDRTGPITGYEYNGYTNWYRNYSLSGTTSINGGSSWGNGNGILAYLRSESQLKSQDMYWGWNFSSIWAMGSGINNGYPVLQWLYPNVSIVTFTETTDQTTYTTYRTRTIVNGQSIGTYNMPVEPTPPPSFNFIEWNESPDGTGAQFVPGKIINTNMSVYPQYFIAITLTLTSGGGGNISGSSANGAYEEGETITLKANPNSGYDFAGWSGVHAQSFENMSNNTTYVISAADIASGVVTLKANFVASSNYWLDYAIAPRYSGGEYIIKLPGELAYLAKRTNESSNFTLNRSWRLAHDIDLSGKYWTPIGYSSSDYRFKGTFNGDNYTINGLTIDTNVQPTGIYLRSISYVGLFGYNYQAVGISNVNLTNVDINGTGSYTGGLVGYNNYTPINNVSMSGTMVSSTGYLGGIAGRIITSSNVTNANVTASISGNGSYVGGVVGMAQSTISNAIFSGTISGVNYVGGIAGRAEIVTNASASGTVSGNSYVGGVVGYANVSSGRIERSINYANVNGTSTQVGGIIGYARGSSGAEFLIQHSANVGTVTSPLSSLGGIAGYGYYCNIYYCYNAGVVDGGSSNTGPIRGTDIATYASYTYYLSGATRINGTTWGNGSSSEGGTYAKTQAQLRNEDTYYPSYWNFGDPGTWAMGAGINNGYPVLQWLYPNVHRVLLRKPYDSGGTIIYNSLDTRTIVHNQSVGADNMRAAPAHPWGYAFVEWNDAENGTGNTFTINTPVTTDEYYVYAQYQVPVNVSISAAANGTIAGGNISGSYYTGDTFNLQALPNAGYKFLNWTGTYAGTIDSTNPNITYKLSSADVASGLTLIANFTTEKYRLNFDVNGGNAYSNILLNADLDYGWSKGYCRGIQWNDIAPPTGVNADVVSFYDANNTSGYWYSYGNYAPQTANTTYTISVYVKTNDSNFRIVAYTADNSETGRQWTNTVTVPDDGQWHRVVFNSITTPSNTQSDSLSFNFNYGDAPGESQRTWLAAPQMEVGTSPTPFNSAYAYLYYGSTIGRVMPPNPTKTGYTFTSWNTAIDGSGATISGSSTMPANTETLYAMWTPTNYNITYILDGGINHPSNPAAYTVEDGTINLQDPTKTGYNFTGWSPSSSIPAGSTGDKTFTANWIVSNYWLDYAVEPENDGTNYNISTPGHLAYLALQCNTVSGWTNAKVFNVINNIDLSGKYWTPIGYGTGNYRSSETFNGNNYTLSGLTIDSAQQSGSYLPDVNFVGMFGSRNGGSINNLIVADISISSTGNNAGGVAGVNYGSLVDNISVSGSVAGNDAVGGIVGNNRFTNSIVQNSVNNANINGRSFIGGIVGLNYDSDTVGNPKVINCTNNGAVASTSSYAGGIVGKNEHASISGCNNMGTVSSQANYIGGITGGAIAYSLINNCSNAAVIDSSVSYIGGIVGLLYNSTLTNSHSKSTASVLNGSSYVGGIAGSVEYDSLIDNCYSLATVTGYNYVSGIAGIILDSDTIDTPTVSNSYNEGVITGTGTHIGGIAGQANSGTTISSTHNTGKIVGNANVGGIVGNSIGTILNVYNTADVDGNDAAGGIAGYMSASSSINDAYNTGNITLIYKSEEYREVGGIAAVSYGVTNNVYNTGTITSGGGYYTGGIFGILRNSGASLTNAYNEGIINGGNYHTGGITGGYYGSDATETAGLYMQNVYNTGAVTGQGNVGGINGYTYGELHNAYNVGMVIGTLASTGPISGYKSYSNPLSGLYYLQDTTSSDGGASWNNGFVIANSISKTVTQLKNQETFVEFDFTKGADWAMGAGTNNGYPVLQFFNSNVNLINFESTVDGTTYTQYATRTIVNGQAIGADNMPTTPTRTGHNFDGWGTAKDASADFTSSTIINSDDVIYSQWSILFYDVNLSAVTAVKIYAKIDTTAGTVKINSGATGQTVTDNIAYNSLTTLTATLANNYKFDGWYDAVTGGNLISTDIEYTFNMPTTDINYFAIMSPDYWTDYKITPTIGDGTNGNPYQINSAENLAWIAYNTNTGGNWSNGKYFELTANVDLAGHMWNTIGDYMLGDVSLFEGNFNGNGYTISNMYIDVDINSNGWEGLFGQAKNATIHDVVLDSGYLSVSTTASSGYYVYGGQLASQVYNSNIYNITSTNSITSTDGKAGEALGGIVGIMSDSTLDNCHNHSYVEKANDTAGIAGRSHGTSSITNSSNTSLISGSPAAGIVSTAHDNLTITDTFNTGEIKGVHQQAGIVGRAYDTVIERVYNSGWIHEGWDSDYSNYVGGIIGYAVQNVVINDAYNTGDISSNTSHADNFAGGIVGWAASASSIKNVYSIASSVTAVGANARAGSLIAELNNSTLETSYYDISTANVGVNGVGINTNGTIISSGAQANVDMKNQDTYSGWSFTDVWATGASINNGYPVLQAFNLSHIINFETTLDGVNYTLYASRTIVNNNAIGADNMPENPTAGQNSTFVEWNENKDGTGIVFTFATVINNSVVVYAQFNLPVAVTITSGANGSVSGSSLNGNYYLNDTITLLATPYEGYSFENWTGTYAGSLASTSSSTTYVIAAEDVVAGVVSLTANFIAQDVTITISFSVGGLDNGSSLNGNYSEGAVIDLRAAADTNYFFVNWTKTNGTGIIVNENALSTTYTVTSEDITSGAQIDFVANFSTSNLWLDYKVEPANDGINYTITSAEELAYLAYQTNSIVNWGAGKFFTLTNDIDLTGKLWTQIGFGVGDYVSEGLFDGAGFIIKGLQIDSTQQAGQYLPSTDYVGLFGSRQNDSIVDLTLNNININVSGSFVGSVVGINLGTTIDNVVTSGIVAGDDNVGGIVGQNNKDNSKIQNSINNASVNGIDNVGGIVGSNYDDDQLLKPYIFNCINIGSVNGLGNQIGGIVGANTISDIEQVKNSGVINGGNYTGGIAGIIRDSGSSLLVAGNDGSVNGLNYTGGITGSYYAMTDTEGANLSMNTVYNTADVTGQDYVGGINGITYGPITTAYNAGNIIANNINSGSITGAKAFTHAITAAYFLQNSVSIDSGSSWGNGYTVSATAKTENELKNQDTYIDFNFSENKLNWAFGAEINQGFPALQAFNPLVSFVTFETTSDGITFEEYRSRTIITGQAVGINNMPNAPNNGAEYNFVEWNINQNGSGVEFTSVVIVDVSINVYAQFDVTVTFDAQGGSGHAPTSMQIRLNTQLGSLPSNPVKEGYSFDSWWTMITGGSEVLITDIINAPVTFYAHWSFYGGIIINCTFDINAEDNVVAFIKITDTTNGSVWNYPLTDGMSLEINVSEFGDFVVEFINPTNHTAISSIEEGVFTINESNTNQAINVTITKTGFEYIYNSSFN